VAAGSNPDKQCILAAVADIKDLGHRKIEEIDGFYFHWLNPEDTKLTKT
jgi:hypothetical protein